MQAKRNSNAQISNRKAPGSRMAGQQSQSQVPPPSQQNTANNNALKERDQFLVSIVKDYLEKVGYPRTLQTFKTERPVKKLMPTGAPGKHAFNGYAGSDQKAILNLFDKGNRQQFFKQTEKMFSSITHTTNSEEITQALKKLEFELNVYFCVYSVHPCTTGSSKKTQVDRAAGEALKKYIDSKGPEVSDESELLLFFALPFIPKPQENPSLAKIFTKEWVQRLRSNLQQALRQYSARSTANSNKENKKLSYLSNLHEIYDRYLDSSLSQSRIKQEEIDSKILQKYERENQELRAHNKQMVSYLDIMQQNLKDLNEASKTNLVQSNRKWFQFSKEILQLTKKALKGENVKDRLENYERFFGTNIDDLIYSTDEISLFEKNSYTEDPSTLPKNGNQVDRFANNQSIQLTPVDMAKISALFIKADRPELEMEICLVLKALKDRLCYHKSAHLRRQVVVSYQRNDLCALKESNYHIQKKLLFFGSERIKQFYLRLMNYISTDDLGNQYLSGCQKLIQNLMGIMGETTEQVPYRKHAIGILQKLSYLKQSQLMMISFGIIPMIFKILRNEQSLNETTIQYLIGLIMNLAVRKESIINFEKHKSEILPILLKFIDSEDNQIKGYVNGTLYVLLQLDSIKKEAVDKYKITEILQKLLSKSNNRLEQLDPDDAESENCVIRQYSYILQRLAEKTPNTVDPDELYAEEDEDEDENEQFVQDIEEPDVFSDDESNSSDYLEGEEGTLNGEQLLMKKYALLGPEAVREQIINRSILDETGRKSNNMTTSINHSKRIDKVFHKNERPETPSLLPGSLDLSITPNR